CNWLACNAQTPRKLDRPAAGRRGHAGAISRGGEVAPGPRCCGPTRGRDHRTQVRQGVRGHNVSTVLIASLAATAVVGFVLFMWVELYPTSVGKHSLPKGAEQRAR